MNWLNLNLAGAYKRGGSGAQDPPTFEQGGVQYIFGPPQLLRSNKFYKDFQYIKQQNIKILRKSRVRFRLNYTFLADLRVQKPF